jgi:acyl-CoA synthetase (AMP-forming)/AMP-acid ligase II
MSLPPFSPEPLALAASRMPLAAHFERWVSLEPQRPALEWGAHSWCYAEVQAQVRRLVRELARQGLQRGDRVCLLSENHPLFVWLSLAALRLGLVVATLNPRLAPHELAHCIDLVEPSATFVSPRLAARLTASRARSGTVLAIDDELVARLTTPADRPSSAEPAAMPGVQVLPPAEAPEPEAPVYIIYTSGTTGTPKGAVLSERALAARLMVYVLDYGVDAQDSFIAWSPLCHMASIELALGMLLIGGKVLVMDGPDLPAIFDRLERESQANFIVFPGMADRALELLRERRPRIKALKKFGALADLFPPAQLAELTALLGVPYVNTFGSTETGMPPASAGRLTAGKIPVDYAKSQSSLCELRLVDEDDRDVADGLPGELLVRGPTLFSGYWNAPQATREAFRGGWYHTGDVFIRRPNGRLDYVDRRKYLIKSGGENIYPAEIERVVAQCEGVQEAVVVRRPDPRWGEVPVLVVGLAGPEALGGPEGLGTPTHAATLLAHCTARLSAFKRPKRVHFIAAEALPRNGTGKIMRAEVERWVSARESAQSGGSASP